MVFIINNKDNPERVFFYSEVFFGTKNTSNTKNTIGRRILWKSVNWMIDFFPERAFP